MLLMLPIFIVSAMKHVKTQTKMYCSSFHVEHFYTKLYCTKSAKEIENHGATIEKCIDNLHRQFFMHININLLKKSLVSEI